jgi:hypothetical protein
VDLDLKGFRERTDSKVSKPISQQELSAMLRVYGIEISQSQISRYEDRPGSVPIDILDPWLRCLGTSLSQASIKGTKANHMLTATPSNPYGKLQERLRLLNDYIQQAPASIGSGNDSRDELGLEALREVVHRLGLKPNILLTGMFDVGKTTIANWLLGEDGRLPEGYQPTTKIVTYIHHVSDRPDWIKERVWLFKEGWRHSKWAQEEHSNSYRLVSGDNDTLNHYGTHDGKYSQEGAKFGLVFLDAPLLESCNLVDHPGHGHDEADAGLADRSIAEMDDLDQMDALIYVSSATRFMEVQEIERLRYLISILPQYETRSDSFNPLSNLFVVASHAHPHISNDQLQDLVNKAGDRLFRHLEEHELKAGARDAEHPVSKDLFFSRLVTFCREMPDRNEKFKQNLDELLARQFKSLWEITADREIQRIRKDGSAMVGNLIESVETVLDNIADAQKLYSQLDLTKESRQENLRNRADRTRANLQEIGRAHEREFLEAYDEIVTPENIEHVVREKFSDKKTAQAEAATFVKGMVTSKAANIARLKGEEIRQEIETFITTLESDIDVALPSQINVKIPFDARGAFWGGVVGGQALGAMAVWASTFTGLGGYGVAATVLGWFGIGGSAWMSGIATIGGPITIAIGIGAVLFFGVKRIFGESWESRLAKEIEQHFRKHELSENMIEGNRKYWADTEKAFDNGVKNFEKEERRMLKDTHDLAYGKISKENAKERLDRYRTAKHFFEHIPWVTLVH